MARKPGLTPEEKALWDHVAKSVAPMHPVRKLSQTLPEAESFSHKPKARAKDRQPAQPVFPPPPADFRIGGIAVGQRGARSFDPAPTPTERLHAMPVRMDHKTHRHMTQGRLRPDARIDLHGMTLAEAQPRLMHFVMNAHSRGCRLVLVITGKGKAGGPDAPLPVRPGALRHNVPHWLHMPPLAGVILQVTPAHRRHGGDGAYYVYLRKLPGAG